jgi:hypothetical protein
VLNSTPCNLLELRRFFQLEGERVDLLPYSLAAVVHRKDDWSNTTEILN